MGNTALQGQGRLCPTPNNSSIDRQNLKQFDKTIIPLKSLEYPIIYKKKKQRLQEMLNLFQNISSCQGYFRFILSSGTS
jgi:hypothetical protein